MRGIFLFLPASAETCLCSPSVFRHTNKEKEYFSLFCFPPVFKRCYTKGFFIEIS